MSRRFNRGKTSKRTHRRDLRLTLERLESRQLLAGLNVWVVTDQNGSRTYDELVDTSAANRLVYVDLDRDGAFDNDEPLAVTNREGQATFRDLPIGTHQVSIVGTNAAQVQSFPVEAASLGSLRNAARGAVVLASNDLAHAWSVSEGGLVSVLDANRRVEKQFALGGSLRSYVQPIGDVAWGIVQADGSPTTRLVQLDLEAGTAREIQIDGVGVGSRFVALARVGEQLMIGLSTPDGPRVASLSVGASLSVRESVVSVGNLLSLESDSAMAGSPAGRWLATASSLSSMKSQIALSDISAGGAFASTIELDGRVGGLHFSGDGKLLLATLVGGGTRVLRVGTNLEMVAELAEATEPVSINSVDGRVVTGNARQPSELIVWNPITWQPTGRIALRSTDNATATTATSAVTDRWGDRLLVATTGGTYEVEMAVPAAAQAVVVDRQENNVRLGVRVVGSNSPPVVSKRATRDVSEDTVDASGSNGLVEFVRDQNGNPLWYTLDTAPRHGSLSLSPDGSWRYLPVEDFYGPDQAVLQVHDGMASASLTVSINVTGVNDPPRGIQSDFVEIQETAPQGSSLGFITVFDYDRDAQYVFTTSDPRFTVVDGQLMLRTPGTLDFETERSIVVDITATDVSRPDFSISQRTTLTVADVNEPPTGIRLSNAQVSENQRGAVIGSVTLDDPDQVDSVSYEVSDDRFEIVAGQLRLRDGVELDYEDQSSIVLIVTATPQSLTAGPIETIAPVGTTVTITVNNENDNPGSIVLSSNIVIARTSGYVVGTVTVQDGDAGTQYQYAVSDARFEVAGQRLKLKDGATVSREESVVSLTITATSQSGVSLSEQFGLIILERSSSQQNPRNPLDVDNDGHVTPRDALILINFLNQFGPQHLDPDQGSGEGTIDPNYHIDVNGDGAITPIDVLIIINYLNNSVISRSSGEGELIKSEPMALVKSEPMALASGVEANDSANPDAVYNRVLAQPHAQLLRDPRLAPSAHSRDSSHESTVWPIYGPIQPGPTSASDLARDAEELDLELESLLDELSLEQFGRHQDE